MLFITALCIYLCSTIYVDGHSSVVHPNFKSTESLMYPMLLGSRNITHIHKHVLLLLFPWLC